MEKDNNNNVENSLISQNKSELSFNIFKSDNDFILIYKKTERIVSAIYLVTKHLTNEEPIKWNLRKEGGTLLSLILSLKNSSPQRSSDSAFQIEKTISIIASQLEVSYLTGIMSETNFEILNAELSKLLSMISSYASDSKEQHVLFDSMFFSGTDKNNSEKNTKEDFKGHDDVKRQNNNVFYKNKETKQQDNKGQNNSEQDSKTDVNEQKDKKTNMSERAANALKQVYEAETATDLRKTNRRTMIVNTIQKKGEVMIKDLVPVIKGCSEKTIQRELAALVKKGVLEKVGERRWSKYMLA